MAKIEIVQTPPGEAPDWVRSQWVGIRIPIKERQRSGSTKGCLSGRPTTANAGGWEVSGKEAIEALAVKSGEAADWWQENVPGILDLTLVFRRDCCEVVE